MSFKQTIMVGWFVILAAFAVACWFYPQLPNPVPTHWDATGHVNGYMPKPWGVLVSPLLMIGIWLLLWALPYISPKGFRLDSFLSIYGIISLAVLVVLFLITLITLLAAKDHSLPLARIVPAIIGLLLLVMGNYFGKFRKNFFIGIRTPWTLASDEVWTRTHRLGGWLFTAAGIIIAIVALIAPINLVPGILIGTAAIAALIPAAGSYVIYRRVEGFKNNDSSH